MKINNTYNSANFKEEHRKTPKTSRESVNLLYPAL